MSLREFGNFFLEIGKKAYFLPLGTRPNIGRQNGPKKLYTVQFIFPNVTLYSLSFQMIHCTVYLSICYTVQFILTNVTLYSLSFQMLHCTVYLTKCYTVQFIFPNVTLYSLSYQMLHCTVHLSKCYKLPT